METAEILVDGRKFYITGTPRYVVHAVEMAAVMAKCLEAAARSMRVAARCGR